MATNSTTTFGTFTVLRPDVKIHAKTKGYLNEILDKVLESEPNMRVATVREDVAEVRNGLNGTFYLTREGKRGDKVFRVSLGRSGLVTIRREA